MLTKRLFLLAILIFCFGVSPVYAQFGKNIVRYSELKYFYASPGGFDVWTNLDPQDPVQQKKLEGYIGDLMNARNWMSGPKVFNHEIHKRIPIFAFASHADMESSNLVGGFMPEGVGAFVESGRSRLVFKDDFSPTLGRAINVHELVHEFQFDIYNPRFVQRIVGAGAIPNGWFEGCAEYIAGLYEPHTRDDIRRRNQRMTASNPKSIPTWVALHTGEAVDPYSMWSMVPEFLEAKYPGGGLAFCTQPLQSKLKLGELVYEMSKGELGNPDVNSEKFDEQARSYWGKEKGYEIERITKPNAYENSDNIDGRTVTPHGHPYPMFSPLQSPDGSHLAAFSVQNNGLAIVSYKIPLKNVYVSIEEMKKAREKAGKANPSGRSIPLSPEEIGIDKVKNLTPQLPPIPWESLVAENMTTWPFNGFDGSWSRDGSNRIAFFARINRDHALVVIDGESGKVVQKIEFKSPGPELNQAFSPSFTPDGKKIIFSAKFNAQRDLYSIDLQSKEIVNLTDDERFDTAPAVSPYGDRAVYVGSDGDFQHLFMYYFSDGHKEQLTFGSFNDSAPSWSDDGTTIVYTSDEVGKVFNLYTLNLASRTISQWTQFFSGVETPLFSRNSIDTVYYVTYRDDDEYQSIVYSNYEIFEAKLKKPVRQYEISDNQVGYKLSFNPNRDLFNVKFDQNQILNPTKPPERWSCNGGQVQFGVTSYKQMFGQSFVGCSNILETKQHLGQFLTYGSYRVIDYQFLNQEKRRGWSVGAHHRQMPMNYLFYDVVKRFPKQEILNNTWANDMSVDFATSYPFNKFNRIEFFSRLRRQTYIVYGSPIEEVDENLLIDNPDVFQGKDIEMFRLLRDSRGNSLSFGSAYVRDTVLYSQNAWGPLHGNALRAQVEFAPSIGSVFNGFISGNVQARMYKRLFGSDSVVFANRIDMMTTTKSNGDFMLLCGPEMLRRCDYGSVAGNQVIYGSTELRFPIPGTGLLGQGVRGLFFLDGAYAKFSGGNFPAQKLRAYGFGLQYVIPFIGMPAQTIWEREDGKWKSTFYMTIHW